MTDPGDRWTHHVGRDFEAICGRQRPPRYSATNGWMMVDCPACLDIGPDAASWTAAADEAANESVNPFTDHAAILDRILLESQPGLSVQATTSQEGTEDLEREWGVRWHDGSISTFESEDAARREAGYFPDYGLVCRAVTRGPWADESP